MRPRDVERMIDQRLHFPDETNGVRQCGVALEGRFVGPTRVDKEQAGIGFER
jgi:hypothetical protein